MALSQAQPCERLLASADRPFVSSFEPWLSSRSLPFLRFTSETTCIFCGRGVLDNLMSCALDNELRIGKQSHSRVPSRWAGTASLRPLSCSSTNRIRDVKVGYMKSSHHFLTSPRSMEVSFKLAERQNCSSVVGQTTSGLLD